MQFTARISDPMWGSVPMTSLESQVLQHRSLARLAQIKQMGLAFLDFPGLSHSRLEHSIGVMHVADQMFQTLRQSDHFPKARRRSLFGLGGSNVRQAVRLAALFHDLGHPPFSHAVESTFKRYPTLLERAARGADTEDDARLFDEYSHEEFTRWSIRGMIKRADAVAKAIVSKLGHQLASEIADLAVGKAHGVLEPFNPIISGEFDADRIDYLIRDNRRSGFVLGLSLEEIHNAIHLRRNERDQYEMYIDASALPFVNSVLLARQRLIRRVHLAPSGRVATQMMINCLYCILDQETDPRELGGTIKWLHMECTDFTFFKRLLERAESIRSFGSGDLLDRYYIERFERVARRPQATNLWPERVNIDFMQMHPCLRLLTHIVASANWQSPRNLTFQDGNRLFFIEPSTRPSQASDLQVDYGRNPHDGTTPGDTTIAKARRRKIQPSLDFIAASENRLGRGILVQAMSNLDVYAYELNPSPDRKVALPGKVQGLRRLGDVKKTRTNTDYWANLKGPAQRVGKSIVALAQEIRRIWPVDELGMVATDYILAVLYALDDDVRSIWPTARGIYVYRSESFVNQFLQSLAPGSNDPAGGDQPDLFPRLFRDPENAGKRIFSQIQRLAAFGLILTRSNSAINRRPRAETGATRFGVYSTREEIRINTWGRCYVENEVDDAQMRVVRTLVAARQESVRRIQERVSDLYMELDAPPSRTTMSNLGKLEAQRLKLAQTIHEAGGCALTFSRADASSGGKRSRKR